MSDVGDPAPPPPVTITIGNRQVTVGGATLAEQQSILAELAARLQRAGRRENLDDVVAQAAQLTRDKNWDWIDRFCHATVAAAVPFIRTQSPNAGADWGALTTVQKAEALQLGLSWALAELIRMSQWIDLDRQAIAALIAAVDVDVPADR